MFRSCARCERLEYPSSTCRFAHESQRLPDSDDFTCEHWIEHPLVRRGEEAERARCAKICRDIVSSLRINWEAKADSTYSGYLLGHFMGGISAAEEIEGEILGGSNG